MTLAETFTPANESTLPRPTLNPHSLDATQADYRARYYSSNDARFMSPDWSKNPQGVPYADYTKPQTLNLYEYLSDNPLGGVDPDGHACILGVTVFGSWFGGRCPGSSKPAPAPATPPNPPPGAGQVGLDGFPVPGPCPCTQSNNQQQNSQQQNSQQRSTSNQSSSAKEITAADGQKITGLTRHGVNRVVGEGPAGTPGVRAGTRPQAILDALKNPEKIESGVDSLGRPFKTYVGKNAEVTVNPQTGKIVQTNPLSGAGAH